MYKLLLVTDQTDVVDAFKGINNWELMGFRAPRIAADAAQAEESLAKHHADGIAVALDDKKFRAMYPLLSQKYPMLPLMRASADQKTVRADTEELGKLLNRTHADYSNDDYDEAEMMQLCRHDYFRDLLMGKEKDAETARRRLRLMRSRMDPDRSCVLIELGYPDDDGYLMLHWHYGADRLEVAMRNFFHAELDGMRILVSVLPDERLYLIACPMIGEKGQEDPARMLETVREHAERSLEDIREYLRIDLNINSVKVLPGILSLASRTE